MKRPILTTFIALAVVIFVLAGIGSLMPGQTKIEESMVMSGTPERIWPLFADLKGWPSWYWAEDGTHMTRSELVNRSGVELGTIRRAELSNGGFWEEKVSAFELNKRLELMGERTPGRSEWRQEVVLEQVEPEKTKVIWRVEYNVSGPITKLLNASRGEDEFRALIKGGMVGVEQKVPTADEWGPATLPGDAKAGMAKDEAAAAPVAGAKPGTTDTPAAAAAPSGDASASAPTEEKK